MDILKHGSLERCYEYDKEHGIIVYFRCPRCMCEFSASSIQIDGTTKNDSYIDPQIENFVNNFGWER